MTGYIDHKHKSVAMHKRMGTALPQDRVTRALSVSEAAEIAHTLARLYNASFGLCLLTRTSMISPMARCP